MREAKSRKKIYAMSAAAALGLLCAAAPCGALAYFTTYVSAGGSQVVNLGARTEIEEDVSSMTKHISIRNVSELNDCFVRVKVFCSGELKVTYNDAGGLWTEGAEGYWYYREILPAGESTQILDVKIGDLPEDFDRESFNVVVIQECTPVVYDEDGNATADWNMVYDEYQEISQGLQGEEAKQNA